jgi:LmbE family N-acetylglucosaminyl deacetylase
MNHSSFLRMRWFAGGVLAATAAAYLLGAWYARPERRSTAAVLATPLVTPVAAAPADDGKLRIIAFGAHPDDCELREAGVAAQWAALGHHVKLVSVTNGDIGHWKIAGGPLAQRRLAEVKRCAEILGSQSQVLDLHDGELMPTLENRKAITRLIRDWKADIVISHRPNDYHPDHRYVGTLVQDSAFMVTVPFFCPDIPYLTKNPVFLFSEDRFAKPNPFQPDIVVSIDDVVAKKLDCVAALESQFYEGGAGGSADLLPKDPAGQAARKKAVYDQFRARFADTAHRFRPQLAEWYGEKVAAGVKFAEAFEICEYGRRPSKEEIRKLFSFATPR